MLGFQENREKVSRYASEVSNIHGVFIWSSAPQRGGRKACPIRTKAKAQPLSQFPHPPGCSRSSMLFKVCRRVRHVKASLRRGLDLSLFSVHIWLRLVAAEDENAKVRVFTMDYCEAEELRLG